MAMLGWWDGELRPDGWWDAELQPAGWFDTEIINTTAGGGINGTGTGSLASVSLTAVDGRATGTSGVVNGTGTGSIAGVTLTVPAGAASGSGVGSGSIAGVTLTAPTGSAVGTTGAVSGTGTGSLAGVTLTAPTGGASGTSSVIDVKVSWIAFDTAATGAIGGGYDDDEPKKRKKYLVEYQGNVEAFDTAAQATAFFNSLPNKKRKVARVSSTNVVLKPIQSAQELVAKQAAEDAIRRAMEIEMDDEEVLMLL